MVRRALRFRLATRGAVILAGLVGLTWVVSWQWPSLLSDQSGRFRFEIEHGLVHLQLWPTSRGYPGMFDSNLDADTREMASVYYAAYPPEASTFQIWCGHACGLAKFPLWSALAVAASAALVCGWLDRRRYPPGHCRRCGYDLTGNQSGRCPECGRAMPDRGAAVTNSQPTGRE